MYFTRYNLVAASSALNTAVHLVFNDLESVRNARWFLQELRFLSITLFFFFPLFSYGPVEFNVLLYVSSRSIDTYSSAKS